MAAVEPASAGDGDDSSTRIVFKNAITQSTLVELSHSEQGRNATEIFIEGEYDEDPPKIDLGAVSFPNLKTLALLHQGLEALNMTGDGYPMLETFHLEQPGGHRKIRVMDFSLPELKNMSIEFVSVWDGEGFGVSLSLCPKLEEFHSYKLSGLFGDYQLVLPNCKTLEIHRSEFLETLDIWAPKLQHLNLPACFALRSVQIRDEKPPGPYKGPEYNFDGKVSKYDVNLLAIFSKVRGNFLSHERCGHVEREEPEPELSDLEAFWEEEDDSDDMEDDDEEDNKDIDDEDNE